MVLEEEPKETKIHEWNILPKNLTPACTPEPRPAGVKKKRIYLAPITWTVGDISKAGCLLSSPPLAVNFDDEQEMRRVYSLIYDVFRYKNVLTQALNDVSFFQTYPKLAETTHHVWLLFYDLYHRSFKKRETAVATLASRLFDSVGLSFAENALWSQRVRLAAAVARLRIKHTALSLDELLPSHLKSEKLMEQAKNNPVTCWVNCTKVNDIKALTDKIERSFNLKMITDLDKLEKDKFKWDRHCPQIMAFHASMRGKLARSEFVKEHILVVQDKSFCRGAATFGKILLDLGLSGSVIQTHVNSPRTTAYLATLLTHNMKIKKLMAFSAGKRKGEYEHYFTEIGITNIRIFSDRLIDSPPDASYMEEVVAVFATPPNSYSAVTDPIDLVCSRGGDLSMLEVLTESKETKEAKERVISILEEQRKTLRFAMSRPQIQFVLYETHSELDAENGDMVSKTLRDINRLAKLQHATLLGKGLSAELALENDFSDKLDERPLATECGDDNNLDLGKRTSLDSSISRIMFDSKEKVLESLQVPDTDIFVSPDLTSLCPSENPCINFKKEGCYLALLQRKEVIRLDDKYMIQMAENRGLFGSSTSQNTGKSKVSKGAKKRQEKQERKPRSRKKLKETEMRDGSSQTSDESSDYEEEEGEDDEELSIKTNDASNDTLKIYEETKSLNSERSIRISVLGRLTSAHIRQFVSPDFKPNLYNFHAPSVLLKSKTNQNPPSHTSKKITGTKKTKQSDDKVLTPKNVSAQEPKHSSNPSVEKNKRKKDKRKFKRSVLQRICSPTLSFILKTRKEPIENPSGSRSSNISNLVKPVPSPCERFNRRNHLLE
ncbi:uncharacterized protein LOC126747764 isoform X2 [Anthonomus grandis grandis]|nr:uncharacterized protein LOC126747764 isoform X2 [Anthonomus grandis grandis]